jgi:hypothetical protein
MPRRTPLITYIIVVFKPNNPTNNPIATSLTKGEVTKKEKVTPNGIPPLTKPIKYGADEQEQDGVTTPKTEAIKYSNPYNSMVRNKRDDTKNINA